MKKLKKIVGIVSVSLVLGFSFISCGFDTGIGGTSGNTSSGHKVRNKIKFNFSDAKALASQEDVNGNRSLDEARASKAANELLVKILEDGTLTSAITLPADINENDFKITQIATSPAEDADEVYVVINEGRGNWGDIGGLLCVYPDGTYIDILKDLEAEDEGEISYNLYGNSSERNYVKFDNIGNMYFQTQVWANSQTTTMIYKYDPKEDVTTVLTPAVSGTWYDDYIVSGDGDWIFASASRWSSNSSTRYLRAIPTADASKYVNITYSSSGSGYYRNMIYDNKNDYLYFTGWKENQSGIFRIQKKDGTFNSADLTCFSSSGNTTNYNNFNFWSMVNQKYESLNFGDMLSWGKSSEMIYEVELKELLSLYVNGNYEICHITDAEGNFKPSEVIKAFLYTLEENDDYRGENKKYTTDKNDETGAIKVDFRFDKFKDVEGFEGLAVEGKNEDALNALNNKESLLLLYKLLTDKRYSYTEKICGHYNNFLADITYVQGTDTLLVNAPDKKYFSRLEDYFHNNCLVIYMYTFNEKWLQKMEWGSSYTSGEETNYQAILEKIFSYCEDGSKEFSLEAFKDDKDYGLLYTTEKDEAAIKYIETSGALSLLYEQLYYGETKAVEFLKKTCFMKGTNESACKLTGGVTYKWANDFYDEEDNLKASDILDILYRTCESGEKEFNLSYFKDKPEYKDLYTDKTDEEAIKFISDSSKLQLISNYVNSFFGGDEGNYNFVKNTCFFKGTTTSAARDESNNGMNNYWESWNYGDIKAMAITSKGIFGSVPGYIYSNGSNTSVNAFMQFFDENGVFVDTKVKDADSLLATEIQTDNDLFVFKNATLDAANQETGSHTMKLFDATEGKFKDLFENVQGENMEIISFSVGGGYVYYSGVQGMTLVSGRINIETLEYTEIKSTKKMNQIITVTQ